MREQFTLKPGSLSEARRNANGMSQARLARAAGLSHGIIAFYETGERQPSADALRRIADALGVDPADLLDEEMSDDVA